jgi:hypothetical protein
MKSVLLSKLLFLFTPEEIKCTGKNHLKISVVQEKHNMSVPSIKAIFWAAVSIICALIIGQLN